ncbi:DUF7848 domain-containing protein [Streptomyces sp. 6N223]|uniref:DUF7848 domain-containing protein n=1 Tax=Streptomyces sp. 6N223 TaxID=3457412 RepID=UPI003FD479D4
MTRAIIKHVPWHLGEETAPGAPRGIFRVECVACGAKSQIVDNESVPVEMWALQHTGRNIHHRQFKLFTEWFLRVSPAPGNPLYELEGGDGGNGPSGR